MKTKTSFSEIVNSPFIVTFLGGLIASLITFSIQHNSAKHDAEALRVKQDYERREKVAYDFADEFPLTLNLADRFMTRQVWLQEHTNGVFDEDGRSYSETRDYYETCLNAYLARRPAGSLCSQIAAEFRSADITFFANEVVTNISIMISATNKAQVRQGFQKCNDDYRELTKIVFNKLTQ